MSLWQPERLRRAHGAATPGQRIALHAVAALGLGLVAGCAFVLPVLALRHGETGSRRTALLVMAAVLAILVVRRAGQLLRTVLDATDRAWRLPLLGLYGLAAMALPASLLLLRPLPSG